MDNDQGVGSSSASHCSHDFIKRAAGVASSRSQLQT